MSLGIPIFEPEFSFLPHGCRCGARFAQKEDLELHHRETCKRRWDLNYREPSIFDELVPGVADGGRRT